MLRYKTDFLKHAFAFQEWLQRTGVKAHIDPRTLNFTIDMPERPLRLIAQFVCRTNEGKLFYTQQFNADTVGFVGWLPYFGKQWELGADKMAFKEFAEFNRISTPRFTRNEKGLDVPFIIKESKSSFGYGIRGPFLPEDIGSPETRLNGPEEFYEEYIMGRIARAWYWNDTLAVLELFDMPRVHGDGHHTVTELIQHQIGSENDVPKVLGKVLRAQGLHPDHVLPVKSSAIADFRYVSPLNPTIWKNFNVLRETWGTPLHQVFVAAGRMFWRGIPKDVRTNTAFVLDAVLDQNGRPYFVEMNTNAQIHPDVYPIMLDSLLANFSRENAPITNTTIPAARTDSSVLTVSLAMDKERMEVEQLRKAAFLSSKELTWRNVETLAWNCHDDNGIVLAVRNEAGELISSMRMSIYDNATELEQFLEYSTEGALIDYPALVMSRAVTHPNCTQRGLMGLLRHVYLTLVRESKIRSVVAVVYDNAPRVNSMRQAGFSLSPCVKNWDQEAELHVQPLIAVLPHSLFESALRENDRRFQNAIETNEIEWIPIKDRFAVTLNDT